jgi:hypothetical protein
MRVITVEQLREMFEGKMVTVSHTGNITHVLRTPVTKKCKTVHQIMGGVDFEFEDGSRYGLEPDTVDSTSVEGDMFAGNGLRRIALIT